MLKLSIYVNDKMSVTFLMGGLLDACLVLMLKIPHQTFRFPALNCLSVQ
ncbi:hypothetical protein NBRC3293_0670 [Gluconobacter oxydans NBRC 3293]|uniref:Uncharacterized protein n=1 Tax=Gluconobacter oxydans NBRC 3293 TaxID=1315969 RepID=A0A829WSM1_GLUOY|nr:hypothetical protein NBRC3293_0670 [Gluconobacter oxydans NBRC 3293]